MNSQTSDKLYYELPNQLPILWTTKQVNYTVNCQTSNLYCELQNQLPIPWTTKQVNYTVNCQTSDLSCELTNKWPILWTTKQVTYTVNYQTSYIYPELSNKWLTIIPLQVSRVSDKSIIFKLFFEKPWKVKIHGGSWTNLSLWINNASDN